jgi:hypothetical protein
MIYIRQILEEKLEYNGTVYQLFLDFKKAYDPVKREKLIFGEKYKLRIHYKIFLSLLLFSLFQVPIFSPAPRSETPTVSVTPVR